MTSLATVSGVALPCGHKYNPADSRAVVERSRYIGDDNLITKVFLQLLDAVDHCHSMGVFHRDLKPENVLCAQNGERLVLADFGLATSERQSIDFGCGSAFYMSPECQGGVRERVSSYSTAANDVWSLGVILVNLTCGRNPWRQATLSDPTFLAFTRDPATFLQTILPLSAQANYLLTRAFELDPARRASVAELRVLVSRTRRWTMDENELVGPAEPIKQAAIASCSEVGRKVAEQTRLLQQEEDRRRRAAAFAAAATIVTPSPRAFDFTPIATQLENPSLSSFNVSSSSSSSVSPRANHQHYSTSTSTSIATPSEQRFPDVPEQSTRRPLNRGKCFAATLDAFVPTPPVRAFRRRTSREDFAADELDGFISPALSTMSFGLSGFDDEDMSRSSSCSSSSSSSSSHRSSDFPRTPESHSFKLASVRDRTAPSASFSSPSKAPPAVPYDIADEADILAFLADLPTLGRVHARTPEVESKIATNAAATLHVNVDNYFIGRAY